MKRLLSIFLAVFLVVSLGSMVFSTQSVKAWRIDGHTFNINAKGQAIYRLPTQEQWEGKVFIVVAGEKSTKIPGYRGRGYTPRAEVGGHISGSFDDHTIDFHTIQGGLQGNRAMFNCAHPHPPDPPSNPLHLIHLHALKLHGNYNSKPISTGAWNQVMVYGDEGSRTIEVILSSSYISLYPLYIHISEATADIFKVKIR